MQSLFDTTTQFTPANVQVDLPAIAVQVTAGTGVYIIWAGTTHAGSQACPSEEGIDAIIQQGRLGADWACSMGSRNPKIPSSGTTLLRTTNEPVALSMSQRLAQRFKSQIFLSIDLDPSHTSGGRSPTVALAVEKAILEVLKRIEVK